MTVERAFVDLVEEVGDLSLVADALRDASPRARPGGIGGLAPAERVHNVMGKYS